MDKTASLDSPFTATTRQPAPGSETIQLRPGLVVHLSHVTPESVHQARFSILASPVIFGFMLAGMNHCRYEEGPLRKKECIHSSGSNGITYLPETCGLLECKGGMHRVSIYTLPEFLEPYLELETNRQPRELMRALQQKNEPLQWIGERNPHKMRLVSEILANAYATPLRNLFLESRALDLIGMQLAEYLGQESAAAVAPVCSMAEIRRIKDARDLLVQDLQNPPSMVQLARLAGMNEKKLKSGFKQIFGTPIFTYFRNYRLETAYELLASGQMNVTEAGMHIGYQSLSHFSQEFRKKYGMLPKDVPPGHAKPASKKTSGG